MFNDRSLKRRSLTMLAIIGVLIVAIGFVNFSLVSAFGVTAATINVAGQQRMLVQRIGKLRAEMELLADEAARSRARDELRTSVDRLEKNHQILLNGDADRHIQAVQAPRVLELYFAPQHRLDEKLRTYIAQVRVHIDTLSAGTADALQMTSLRHEDLPGLLNEAVLAIEADSRNHVDTLQRVQVAFVLGALVFLAIATFGFFIPALHALALNTQRYAASRNSLKLAQKIAHIGSWTWDVVSDAVTWSDETYRIYGHQPGAVEVTYEKFLEAIFADDRDAVQAAVAKALEKREPYSFEFRILHADGTLRYVREQGETTYDRDGKPLRMDGTVQDITDQKAVEIAMRENEKRFRSMVENAGDAIYIHDRYGKIHDINQVACDQTGYSRDELLSLSVAQLDAAIDFDDLRDTWDLGEVDPAHYPMNLETAHRRKDGTVFPIEVRISLLPAEDGHLFVAVVRDITDRKQVEKELSQKVRELDFQKSALDEHAIVSIADVKGNITYINEKFCEISGYAREELLGKNHRIVKSGDHTPEFYADLWHTIASGKPWRGEIKNLKKGGGYYWVDATIVPFLNESGKPFQYVAIRTDITERVLAKEEAERANLAKSEFLSSMSHELRTPLNAILGFSQLLETDRKNPLTDKQLLMVDQISKGGKHLLGLINDILDLAKIEAGKLSISIEDVLPWDIVSASLSLVGELAKKRNVHVAVERSIDCPSCDAPCAIRVDQNRFRQVLLNLLSNAVKYNRDGGEVTLTCARTDGGTMRFTVSDTGMGIPQSLQGELFTPFNRLGAESGEIEGTGIGLTITKTLTELMGGKIGFSSREGEGSAFWVELPIASDQGLSSDISFDHANVVASRESKDVHRTVLYIEDNPANLHLMEMIFDRLPGVRMISAHTAELGLEMAKRDRPDLILMDINLPGMNGVEALKQIQASEALHDTPVVAVSANAMKNDIERALQLGFKGYITKPFEVQEIIALVSLQFDE